MTYSMRPHSDSSKNSYSVSHNTRGHKFLLRLLGPALELYMYHGILFIIEFLVVLRYVCKLLSKRLYPRLLNLISQWYVEANSNLRCHMLLAQDSYLFVVTSLTHLGAFMNYAVWTTCDLWEFCTNTSCKQYTVYAIDFLTVSPNRFNHQDFEGFLHVDRVLNRIWRDTKVPWHGTFSVCQLSVTTCSDGDLLLLFFLSPQKFFFLIGKSANVSSRGIEVIDSKI